MTQNKITVIQLPQVLLHFVLQKLGFAGWQKEGPPFTLWSKGAEGAQQPAGWARGWLHPGYLRKIFASESCLPLSCAFVFSGR